MSVAGTSDLATLLAAMRARHEPVVVEPEGYPLLTHYGVGCPMSVVVGGAGEAAGVDLAAFPGERVVVKIASAEILHRSDVRGVAVVPKTSAAVTACVRDLAQRLDPLRRARLHDERVRAARVLAWPPVAGRAAVDRRLRPRRRRGARRDPRRVLGPDAAGWRCARDVRRGRDPARGNRRAAAAAALREARHRAAARAAGRGVGHGHRRRGRLAAGHRPCARPARDTRDRDQPAGDHLARPGGPRRARARGTRGRAGVACRGPSASSPRSTRHAARPSSACRRRG